MNNIHLMLEDFSGSGDIAGDVYFDNILLTDSNGSSPVPEPASMLLFGMGILGFAGFRKKKKA